jgi:antirestriction protein ArdC
VETPTKLSPQQVYEAVTNRILELLEKDTIPWRKPWAGGWPHNLFSKREYRGINALILANAGFGSAGWATENQIHKHGGRIKDEQADKPALVFLIKPSFWVWNDPQQVGWQEEGYWCKSYQVWNFEQTEGLDRYAPKRIATPPIEAAAKLVAEMPLRPPIKEDSRGAFYHPRKDFVGLPARNQFNPPEEYYSTLFHELTHATGHPCRLGRKSLDEIIRFGSHEYSQEELVAELGAAFLCALAGIAPKTVQNSTAYIKSWLRVLKNDRALFHKAAGQAQKAADFIRNRIPPSSEPPAVSRSRSSSTTDRNQPETFARADDELERRHSAEVLDVVETAE